MQLHHILEIKSGAIIIGEAMSGKTTAIKVLTKALNRKI